MTNQKPITGHVIEKGDQYDHHDVQFKRGKHTIKGFGYLGKERGSYGLVRCPECQRENYAMAVSTGICSWCNFNMANIEVIYDRK